MSAYMEYFFWSPLLGCHASRLSIFNDQGDEYFTIIPRADGKAHRVARSEALEMLEDAIQAGEEPGEIIKQGEVGYGDYPGGSGSGG